MSTDILLGVDNVGLHHIAADSSVKLTDIVVAAIATMAGADGESGRCCICLDSLDKTGFGRQRLPCGHLMHEDCVSELRRRGASGRCPICRENHNDLTPVQVIFDRALVNFRQRHYTDCVRFCGEVLDVDPHHVHASQLLGDCYLHGFGVHKDFDRAEELYDVARDGGIKDALLNLAFIHEQRGDVQKAQSIWEELRQDGYADAAFKLGMLAQKRGDERKAKELWEEAHRAGDSDATYNLAVYHAQRGDWFVGNRLMEEAWNRGNANAALRLADLAFQRRDLQEAQRLWEGARHAGNAEVAFQLAGLCQQRGDLRNAEILWEEALQGGFAAAAFNLGLCHKQRGDLKKAGELWEVARGSGIADAAAQAAYNLGVIRELQGDWRAAQTLVEEAWRGGYTGPCADEQDEVQAERLETPKFKVGDVVWIQGLSSPAGHALNGLSGNVTMFVARKDRYAVEIPGVGQKLLKAANLSKSSKEGPTVDQMAFDIGDTVFVQNLQTLNGTRLNGLCGKVTSFDARNGRYGVDIVDVGQKAFKAENLTKQMAPAAMMSTKLQDFEESLEEVAAQACLEADARETSGLHAASNMNARVSAALAQTLSAGNGPRVWLLKLSRRPSALRELLLQAPELAECRRAMEQQGFAIELSSGAKVFVDVELYDATMEAIRLAGWALHPNHIIVTEALEPVVHQVLRQLRGREHVHLKDSRPLPLAFPDTAAKSGYRIKVTRTFIHVTLPSSMRSESQTGVRTVSTTDADPTKGGNPRRSRRNRTSRTT